HRGDVQEVDLGLARVPPDGLPQRGLVPDDARLRLRRGPDRARHFATPKWTSGKSSSPSLLRSASITSMTVRYSTPGLAVIVTWVSSLNSGRAFFSFLAHAVSAPKSYESPRFRETKPTSPTFSQPGPMLPLDVLSDTPSFVIQAERLSALLATSLRTPLPPM